MHGSVASRPTHLGLTQILAIMTVLFGLLASAHDAAAQQAAPSRFDDVAGQSQDTGRVHAVEHSDAYYTRLTIHRYGSFVELPLFAAQYYLGSKLIKGNAASWVKPTHQVVAGSLGALFAVNTVTGVWNLVESRRDPHAAKRFLHAAFMLGADAGFAYTGLVTAQDARHLGADADKHRTAALVSIGSATVGTLIMWLWKDPD